MVSLAASGLLALAGSASALTVTTTGNADTLANNILGPGVTLKSASYSGASVASGTFSGGAAAGIGIDKGIVLTSGYAQNVNGNANTSDGITGDNGLDGYTPLNALIPGYTTYDATYLTITFETTGGDLFFNYVFGSEEYNEWVGSVYNDVFGFFLNGTALANNIALIPGTSTPVAINNVNNNVNSVSYNNNDAGEHPFEYDGFTTVFTASAFGLGAGEHTIVLAIADAGDHVLDSGVFIQANSFADEPQPPGVPEGGVTALLLGLALAGMSLVRRRA